MRKEHSHQSEMVSQLLYGDCFKIISTKKEWVQISALEDEYTGWIDQKQFKSIAQKDAVDLTKKMLYIPLNWLTILKTRINRSLLLFWVVIWVEQAS